MNRKLLIKVLMFMVCFLGIGSSSYAQFKVEEDFKGSTPKQQNVVFKGDAYLTASTKNTTKFKDVDGDGWLRLTEDVGGKNGGVIIDEAFKSEKGVVLDFEYKTWRTVKGGDKPPVGKADRGGDGFTVFLIDGKILGNDVTLGGNGHHLGYGGDYYLDDKDGNKPKNTAITGGYLGLGLDEYGNYIFSGTNGYYYSHGIVNGQWISHDEAEDMRYSLKNSIGLRGKSVLSTNTTPLIGFTTLDKGGYEVGYPSILTDRPSDVVFYRRVQMELYKYGNGYRVEVRWMREKGGTFEHLFTSEYTEAPFDTLKIGFAASTGSAVNFHEIRGLSVFVPEGVKVEKKVNKDTLIVGEDLEYTVEVRNLSQSVYTGVVLNDLLDDLKPYFEVESISFRSELSLAETKATNFNTSLKTLKDISINLGSRDAAVFTIKGKVKQIPSSGKLVNTANIDVSKLGFTSEEAKDPKRLTSTVETKVGDGTEPVGPDFCDNEGDKFISGFHSTIVKTKYGFEIFGENAQADGTSKALDPLKIIPTNGFKFKGSPLLATLGSGGSNSTQNFLLTTQGLYKWGSSKGVIDKKDGTGFISVELPRGIQSSDIKYMTASHGVLVLLTNNGMLHTLGNNNLLYGDGSKVSDVLWHKVLDEKGSDVKNVKSVSVHAIGGFALLENNTFISWGAKKYDGNGNVETSGNSKFKSSASVVSSPLSGSEKPIEIAVTGGGRDTSGKASSIISYFVLGDSGKVYALGGNRDGQLGNGTIDDQHKWDTVKVNSKEELTDVIKISGSDNTTYEGAIGAINKYGKLFLWGKNGSYMLGQPTSDAAIMYASVPEGFLGAKGKLVLKAVYLEVGGHTSMYMNEDMKFCYVGHKINGSMGDGKETSTNVKKFDCENTPNISDMCAKIEILPEPGLVIEKTGTYEDKNRDGIVNVGDVINYTFTVTNSGNVLLKNITITDDKVEVKVKIEGKPIDLIAGEINTESFTGVYKITQIDIERGGVLNIATGNGVDKDGGKVTTTTVDPNPNKPKPTDPNYPVDPRYPEDNDKYKNCETCTVTLLEQQPSITLVKVGVVDEDANTTAGNGVINYTFTITNTGNVSLTLKDFTDSKIPDFIPKYTIGGTGSIEVGQTWTATATYEITDADVNAEQVKNRAKVKGTAPKGKITTAESKDEKGLDKPTITPVEGGGPLITNPHIYHKVQ